MMSTSPRQKRKQDFKLHFGRCRLRMKAALCGWMCSFCLLRAHGLISATFQRNVGLLMCPACTSKRQTMWTTLAPKASFDKPFWHTRLLCKSSQSPASLRSGSKCQGHDSGNAWNLGKVAEGIAKFNRRMVGHTDTSLPPRGVLHMLFLPMRYAALQPRRHGTRGRMIHDRHHADRVRPRRRTSGTLFATCSVCSIMQNVIKVLHRC